MLIQRIWQKMKQVQHTKKTQNNILAFPNTNIYNNTAYCVCYTTSLSLTLDIFFATGIAKSDKYLFYYHMIPCNSYSTV